MGSVNHLRVGAPFPFDIGSTLAYTLHTLDANTERCAVVLQCHEAATITHVGFRYGARTGTPPTYRISLQALGTDGSPDNTVLGGGSPASATFTPPADASINGLWQEKTLANSLAVTRGQFIAVVIDYSSGTIDASNMSTFAMGVTGLGVIRPGFPYTSLYTGTWARGTTQMPIISLRDSVSGVVIGAPWQATADTTVSVSGNRAALKFSLPTNMGSTYKVLGVRFAGTSPAAANTWTIGLWNAAGTVIHSVAVDSDTESSAANGLRSHEFFWTDASLTALDFGTTYYIGIQRASSNVILNGFSVAATTDLVAFPGGSGWCLSTWNGSAWSDVTMTRPFLELILDDVTAAAGGGVMTPPKKTGGFHRSNAA